jgi:hypothetical protein
VVNLYAPEARETSVRCPLPWGACSSSLLVLRLGGLGEPAYDCAHVARSYELVENPRVTLQFSLVPEIVGAVGDGGYTSDWQLTGLRYGRTAGLVPGRHTRGKLDLNLAVSDGTVTVTLLLRGSRLAEGTAPVQGAPFTVDLQECNGSGLAGSLTLAPNVASLSGATLYARWPAGVLVKRGQSQPPSETVAELEFHGEEAMRWTEPADLPAGTYYYCVAPVSDTGLPGADSNVLSVNLAGAPRPPANLAYDSGDAAATTVRFASSPTPGAQHRGYLQQPGDPPANLDDDPAATAQAHDPWQCVHAYSLGQYVAPTAWNGLRYECTVPGESGLVEPTWPLTPGLTVQDAAVVWTCRAYKLSLPPIVGYPGTARVVVRAAKDGVEERNLEFLDLEYDGDGKFVPGRPNVPGIHTAQLGVTDGLTLSVPGIYSPHGEKGVATHLKLFVRAPLGSYDYGSPCDSAALEPTGANGLKSALLRYTFPQPGWHYVRILAATAEGTLSDPAQAPEAAVLASAADAPAPELIAAWPSRG